jgi:hypothetical protein
MRISVHVDALRNDLAAVAALGDEQAAEVALRVAGALEASFRLRFLDAVSEVAHELSDQIGDGRVEVRLAAGEPSLVFVPDEEPAAAAPAGGDDAFSARITLRLPESLKAAVDAAANHAGVSVNTWLVQAVKRALDARPPRRPGTHFTGFARS